MKNVTCVFDLTNDSQDDLLLYLEPEGMEFTLPVGKMVQVQLFGGERPIEMKHSNNAHGQKTISFWPVNGKFELLFEGRSVWDKI